MQKIQVAVADDHQLFREGLSTIINFHPKFDIIIEANDGLDLIRKMENQPPDVVLLDLKMPKMDGIEAVEHIKVKHPAVKIIILTMHHQEDFIIHMLKLGVNAYLFKNTSSQEVCKAIEAVMLRDYYFDDHISQTMLRGLKKKNVSRPKMDDEVKLTPREVEILELICKEYTTSEIAGKLFISTRTVETHRKNLLEKLGVKNTVGLVVKAISQNIYHLNGC